MDNNQFPNNSGITQPVDFGMTQPADMGITQPADMGMTQPVDFDMTQPADTCMTQPVGNINNNQQPFPAQPQTGFNQGYPTQPQTGFNQGYPAQPQTGFNQGYPTQPQTGFNQGQPFGQSGFNQPQTGFNQGYPTQPQTGFNQGYPVQPQTGYPNQGYNMQGYGQPKPKKPLSKGAKIGIIATVCVAILAIVLVLILKPKTGAKSKEEAAKEFIKAWANYDAETMIKYSMPKQLKAGAEKFVKTGDFTYWYGSASNLEEAYQIAYFGRRYNSSNKVQVRNLEVSIDEKLTPEEIKEFTDYVSRNFNTNLDVKEMYELRVDLEYLDTSYYNDWDDDYTYLYVYKLKNRWYVFPEEVLD